MTSHAAIIASYEANEKAMRAVVPGKFLLPEDVQTCIEITAEEHVQDVAAVKDIMRDHWVKEPV